MIWVLSHFVNKKSYIRFKRVSLRLRPRIIRNIFSIGMSPFIMNVCACCIVIFINNRLLNYGGDLAIGAFGILNRIQMLFVMIVMGITMGMQPISGYNYGAGNIDRVKRTLKLGIVQRRASRHSVSLSANCSRACSWACLPITKN